MSAIHRVHGLLFADRAVGIIFGRQEDADTLRRHAATLVGSVAGAARAARLVAEAAEERSLTDDLIGTLTVIEFAAAAANAMLTEAGAGEQGSRDVARGAERGEGGAA